ncbi:hypothetical protein [Pseudomonas coleopterorum]|uniref:hypothetical protein n=1 Tax=Pseudomonas coleopterorum TaxID=1605838 RepID=UPI000B84A7A3|nr:hypothetical protein [Pseudomonas coleopterorum]
MFKQTALGLFLLGCASLAGASLLTEEQTNITKYAGYLWAVKEISPEVMTSSVNIVETRMKAIAQKDDLPMMTFAALRNTANTNSQIIVSYVKSQYKAGKDPDIKGMTSKALAFCKKSGISVGWKDDKMSFSLDDIGDVL